ncbi:MAG: homoserine O-acetyltransferase [Polyangiaceae bacterium]|nr:homoserine O-acetyltransferase [Polyangiaceae bacterium]
MTEKLIAQAQSITLFENAPFRMEVGADLSPVQVAFETYGQLNSAGDNAVLICHALTGSAHAAWYNNPNETAPGWWDPLIGPGRAFDTNKYFVVCTNVLGGCYGTTGPTSINPKTGLPWRMSFPQMSIRDMVHLQKATCDALGIKKLVTVAGGSMGGMQVLEWPLLYPSMVQSIMPIATAWRHSAWCVALHEPQRQAILLDPDFNGGNYTAQPARGIGIARSIAMISYRSDAEYALKFKRDRVHQDRYFDAENPFQVESYLRYQGQKLVERFDACTYLYITWAMDQHDISRGRGPYEDVLKTIRVPALCAGISSDVLYPVHEQKELAQHLGNARYVEFNSIHGHDAFLIEWDQVTSAISNFLTDVAPR